MNIVSPQVGIDVAKDELLVCVESGKPFQVFNTEEGCQALVPALPAGSIVHLECSGGYERKVERILKQAGIQVHRHNALKARRLSQALGIAAKTDPVDSRALSNFGALLAEPHSKSIERQRLADFSRSIDKVKQTIAQYKKRRNIPELDEDAKSFYTEVIELLEQLAIEREKAFARRIKASSLADKYKLLMSIPNIGPATARVCICELPENADTQNPAQICSYAGLAPIDDSSGKRNAPKHLGRGNSRLKKAFYMPAISALLFQPWARALYARLMAKGKTHQQAIVPVMRRLLVRVVAVLKRGSPWMEETSKD